MDEQERNPETTDNIMHLSVEEQKQASGGSISIYDIVCPECGEVDFAHHYEADPPYFECYACGHIWSLESSEPEETTE